MTDYTVVRYPKKKRKKKKALKIKTISYKKAKKLAWDAVSLFVRKSAADPNTELAECYTCLLLLHWKKGHAGHFEQGRRMAILFDIRGIKFQCPQCNIFLHGNLRKFEARMRQDHGQELIDELDALNETTRKYTVPELLAVAALYEQKLKELT